ncbi:endonuclease/exonuclease/phosphatase family protein [uncultured Draconibacterium sp.]|mgnify:CR=1 FL=1|uniref:endonuclease/exonuclease/phosphatase family protein n=1 Tax=uncultured Draconibacterium sp. TaxID=1573823 RepID=UPI0025FE136C|nr:endonuclease/exonuclease/phosphatase family protein [uncultured Draconibacterium sp.]
MKRFLASLIFLFPIILTAQQINVLSYNIRYNNSNDGINAWPNRVEMVNGLLQFYEPDIFGLQEALFNQISDIDEALPNYEWFGVGREDGDKGGEFSPVFFNRDKFILIEKGNFWLAEDCTKPGLGWDAACTRICTWGKFQSKISGKKFYVFNTHFDHRGDEARKNSAILIRDKIEEMTYKNNLPVLLTGDFNLKPETLPISLLKKYLNDSRDISAQKPYGPVGTYNGFKFDAELQTRIDYIFVRGFKVLKYAVLTDNKEQRWPSDHLPVFVQLQLK